MEVLPSLLLLAVFLSNQHQQHSDGALSAVSADSSARYHPFRIVSFQVVAQAQQVPSLVSFNLYQSQAQAVQSHALFDTATVSPLGFDLVQVVRAAPSVYAGCVMIQAVQQQPMVVHGIHLSFVSVQQDQHNYMMFPYGEVFPPGLFSLS